MARVLAFVYGVVSYAIFFVTFLYAIGFLGNFGVPKSIDSGAAGPLGAAVLVNTLLLSLFAIQHSVMARPAFKARWTKLVPKPIERSTYTLLSALALIAVFALWRPMPGIVWDVESALGRNLLWAGFAFGWGLVLVATFLINHFDLFGLRQVWLYLRGREYTQLPFATPGPYRWVRHPLYVGWFFAFWSTPTMTLGHLFFATVASAYILVAVQLEERDLVRFLGNDYARYRQRVPMFVPGTKRRPLVQPPDRAAHR